MAERQSIDKVLGAHGEAIANLDERTERIENKLDKALEFIHEQKGRATIVSVFWSAGIAGLISWFFNRG